MKQLIITLITMLASSGNPLQAELKLPQIIRDSMILQRDMPINIWGWSAAGEFITVKFRGKTFRTRGDAAGNWKLRLPATPAGGPYTMELKGSNTIRLKEILFGEVWFCSGQSNMVHQMNIHDIAYAKEIATANYPQIRQFLVPTNTNPRGPVSDLPSGNWNAAVGEALRPFSAVAYFFAKKIHEQYNVPVGIINASVGGSPIQAWIGEDGLAGFGDMQQKIADNKARTNALAQSVAQPLPAPEPLADKGLSGPVKWFEKEYIPKGWRNIYVPGYWEDQGMRNLNGIVWYRRDIHIPASMTDRQARIFLGRIVDADEVYINGKKAGATGYQYPQRRYHLAPGILQPGKNSIVVRVTNHSGKGGFVPDKPYYLVAGEDTLDLSGQWQYKVGVVQSPVANDSASSTSNQYQPAALYNAMVAPVSNYTIRGFCWYQGESNAGKPAEYKDLSIALVNQWRNKWKQGDLPFLYVQLPGYMDYEYLPAESNWAQMRESQLQLLSLPYTGMAIAIDLGEWNDIHPDNKKDVGERLALNALKIAYGESIVYSGPLFREAVTSGNRITLHFDHTGGGLITNDGEPPGEFAIAGADKKFVWAQTSLQNNTIIVWSDQVPEPKYVRYAWANNPVQANVYNREGLPASPFRTDQ